MSNLGTPIWYYVLMGVILVFCIIMMIIMSKRKRQKLNIKLKE